MRVQIDTARLIGALKTNARSRKVALTAEPLDIVQNDGRFIEDKINEGIGLNQIAEWLVDMYGGD